MRTIYAICIAAAMLFSTASFSQFDTYLKIDGIPGSSTKARHLNEIEVFSYSTGLSSCPDTGPGNGGKVCKAFISDLNVMIKMEKSLIPLKMALLQGKVIAFADMTLEKAGSSPFTFFKMRMEEVSVTTVQESGSGGGDSTPTVSTSLGFGRVAWEFTEQKPDGSAGAKTTGGWDIKGNKPWTYAF